MADEKVDVDRPRPVGWNSLRRLDVLGSHVEMVTRAEAEAKLALCEQNARITSESFDDNAKELHTALYRVAELEAKLTAAKERDLTYMGIEKFDNEKMEQDRKCIAELESIIKDREAAIWHDAEIRLIARDDIIDSFGSYVEILQGYTKFLEARVMKLDKNRKTPTPTPKRSHYTVKDICRDHIPNPKRRH